MTVIDAPALEGTQAPEEAIQDLIGRIRAGDLDAFEVIIRRHEKRVLSMAVQMGLSPADAQDAGQEVFLRVFRYLGGFQTGKNFEVWVWRIAVNVVYDALRKRRDRAEIAWDVLPEEGLDLVQRQGSLQIHLENAELCALLLKRMSILSKQERMVFVLRELQELETGEVAKAMRISSITVRRHAASAKQKLRKAMEDMVDPGK